MEIRKKFKSLVSYLFITAAFISFSSLQGCDNNNNPVIQLINAKSIIAHASPNAPNVDIYLDNNLVASNVAYLDYLPYTQISPGVRNVKVNVTGTMTSVINLDLNFDAATNYSIFAIDSVANLSAIRYDDDLTTPASGKAHVRFIHLSPNAPAVDIAVTGGPVLFSNYTFKQASVFTPVDAGVYDLEVRLAGSTTVVLSLPGIDLSNGKIYTVFARGFVGGTGTQALGASIIPNN
ncbi:MAG TPA: DUF4397 domain-containing protein [Ignavibacteria bacterium]|nr:DUF4397 domain-containing protein [Ignavibacteria bacterium]